MYWHSCSHDLSVKVWTTAIIVMFYVAVATDCSANASGSYCCYINFMRSTVGWNITVYCRMWCCVKRMYQWWYHWHTYAWVWGHTRSDFSLLHTSRVALGPIRLQLSGYWGLSLQRVEWLGCEAGHSPLTHNVLSLIMRPAVTALPSAPSSHTQRQFYAFC